MPNTDQQRSFGDQWPLGRIILVSVVVMATVHVCIGLGVMYWAAMTDWSIDWKVWDSRLVVCAFMSSLMPMWGLVPRKES